MNQFTPFHHCAVSTAFFQKCIISIHCITLLKVMNLTDLFSECAMPRHIHMYRILNCQLTPPNTKKDTYCTPDAISTITMEHGAEPSLCLIFVLVLLSSCDCFIFIFCFVIYLHILCIGLLPRRMNIDWLAPGECFVRLNMSIWTSEDQNNGVNCITAPMCTIHSLLNQFIRQLSDYVHQ